MQLNAKIHSIVIKMSQITQPILLTILCAKELSDNNVILTIAHATRILTMIVQIGWKRTDCQMDYNVWHITNVTVPTAKMEKTTQLSEGWLRENCNMYDDKSCNQHMNYTCGDWVQEGLSKYHLCVDTKAYTCNRPSNFNGTTYNVTCDGNIGDKCNYTGDCNSAFGYTCADWIENETSAGLFC